MHKRVRDLAGKAHLSKMNKIERRGTLIIENVTLQILNEYIGEIIHIEIQKNMEDQIY